MHIKSSKLEEVHCSGLVTLSRNVKHIDTKIVFRMNICSLQNEELAHIRVTSEGGKMQGCEAITMVLLIYPVCELLRIIELGFCQAEKCFSAFTAISKSAFVQQSPSI